MTIAVRYDTKTGNTQKLADAIADPLGVPAHPLSVPLPEKTDMLFLGSAVYGADVSRAIQDFIANLNPRQVGTVVCFSTAALLPGSYAQVSALLRARHIPVHPQEFHCRGQFYLLHRGRPNREDLDRARTFAAKMAGVAK